MSDFTTPIKKENYKSSKKRKIERVGYAEGGEVDPSDIDPQSAIAAQGLKQGAQALYNSEPVQNAITGAPAKQFYTDAQAAMSGDQDAEGRVASNSLGMAMGSLEGVKGKATPRKGRNIDHLFVTEDGVVNPKGDDAAASDLINKIKQKDLSFFEPTDSDTFTDHYVSKDAKGDVRGALGLDENAHTQSIKVDEAHQGKGIASKLYREALNDKGLIRSAHERNQLDGGHGLWKKFSEENPHHVRQARDPNTLKPLDYKVWEAETNVPLRKKEMALESKIDAARQESSGDEVSEAIKTSLATKPRPLSVEEPQAALEHWQRQLNSPISLNWDGTPMISAVDSQPFKRSMSEDYILNKIEATKQRVIDAQNDAKTFPKVLSDWQKQHSKLLKQQNSRASDLDNLIKQHKAINKKSGHTLYNHGGMVKGYAEGGSVAEVPDFIPDSQFNSSPESQPMVDNSPTNQTEAPSFVSDDQFQDDSEKYSSTPLDTFKAGLEGGAKGVAGPLATGAEVALGVDPEAIRGRAEQNPLVHGGMEALGLGASMATGIGEGALVAQAAAKVASHIAAKVAFETGLIAAGDEVSKLILHDPHQSIQSAVTNVGLASLIGGAGGAALGKLSPLWEKVEGVKAEKFINDLKSRLDYRLGGEDLAQGIMDAPKTAGVRLADALMNKAYKNLSGQVLGGVVGSVFGKALGSHGMGALFGAHALAPLLDSVLPAITKRVLDNPASASAAKAAIDYGMAVVKGQNMLGKASRNLFKAGAEILPEHAMATEDDTNRLDRQVKDAMKNPEKYNEVAQNSGYLPEHAQAGVQLAARAVEYLSSLKPNVAPLFPLDSKNKLSPMDNSAYTQALKIAQQPLTVLHNLKQGTLTPSDMKTITTVYPDLYQSMVNKVSCDMGDHMTKGGEIPYKMRMGLSVFLGQPMDSTMSPQAIQSIQSLSTPKLPDQGEKGGQKVPSEGKSLKSIGMSNSTNLQRRGMAKSLGKS